MFRLRLFGGIALEEDGRPVVGGAARQHPLALLALLSRAPSRTSSRGKLAGRLWSDVPEETARGRLNTHVYQIRSALGEEVLVSLGDELHLDTTRLACDVCSFDDAFGGGQLETAVALHRGPFLDGFRLRDAPSFEKWVDRERDRLRRRLHEALETLAERAEAGGAPHEAERWWRERMADDPFNSRIASRLMMALAAAGNPAEALRVAQEHDRLLEDELGATSPGALRELAARLRQGEMPVLPTSVRPERPAGEEVVVGSLPRIDATASPPDGPTHGAREERRRPAGGRRLRLATIGVVLLTLIGVGAAFLRDVTGGVAEPDVPRALAVLPFEDLSGNADDDYFAEGIHDEIITHLARLPGLDVISRRSVLPYRDPVRDLRSIAEELGADLILEGSVRRIGDRVRITTQLVDAGGDLHLWARSYDRDVADVFAIQTDVAMEVARALAINVGSAERRRLDRGPTSDMEAYDFFQRGMAYRNRPPAGLDATIENRRIALQMFERALARDSTFAEAWARKAEVHLDLFQFAAAGDEAHLDRALAAATRARDADPGGSWGHLALAELYRRGTHQPDRALEHYEASGFTTAEVLAARASLLRTRGRLEEAATSYERARSLDPLNPQIAFQAWWVYAYLQRFEEAEGALKRVLELSPDHEVARLHLSLLPLYRDGDARAVEPPGSGTLAVRWRLGDVEGALAAGSMFGLPHDPLVMAVERGLVRLDAGDTVVARVTLDSARRAIEEVLDDETLPALHPALLSHLGLAYAGLGNGEAALRAIRSGLERAREVGSIQTAETLQALVLIHLLLGDEDAALDALATYVAGPGKCSIYCLATHPHMERLRDNPRFKALVERYGGPGD